MTTKTSRPEPRTAPRSRVDQICDEITKILRELTGPLDAKTRKGMASMSTDQLLTCARLVALASARLLVQLGKPRSRRRGSRRAGEA